MQCVQFCADLEAQLQIYSLYTDVPLFFFLLIG